MYLLRLAAANGPTKRLRTVALSLDDFPPLSTLSSTSSLCRVELVRPASALTGVDTGGKSSTYVMKTVDKRWAFRMRAVSLELLSPLPSLTYDPPLCDSPSNNLISTSSPSYVSACGTRKRTRNVEYRASSPLSSRRPRSTSSCHTSQEATFR